MIAQRARLVTLAVAAVDQLVLAATYLLAPHLLAWGRPASRGMAAPILAPLWLLALLAPLWAIAFAGGGLYAPRLLPTRRREFVRLARVCAVLAVALVLLASLMPASPPLSLLLAFLAVNGPATFLGRRAARALVLAALGPRYVLVAGDGPRTAAAAALLARYAPWGVRLVGVAADDVVDLPPDIQRLGTLDDIPRLLHAHIVDEVVIASDRRQPEAAARFDAIVQALQEQGVTVRLLLDPAPRRFARVTLDRLGSTPLLTLAPTPQEGGSLLIRRIVEPALALLLLALLSPLLLLIALAIKLTSPGPVLFRQIRCGLNGRPFTFLKFRTMYAGAERLLPALAPFNEMDGPVFKMARDPRVTPLGRLLRRTSLDELPQLWNILRGDMSFVGPRPAVPEEVARYEPWQRRRLSVKPGLTGLWQVSGRSDLSFEGWIRLDLEYIDHRSLWEDLKILLRTIPAVLRGRGAW